jgi:hypothetical protein
LRGTWGPFPPWADIVLAGLKIATQFETET